MKIAHIINTMGSGGAEKLLTELLPSIQGFEHESILIALNKNGSKEEYINILSNKGIKTIFVKNSGLLYSPVYIPLLRRILNIEKPDVIHVHLFPAQYWTVLACLFKFKFKPILVTTEHNNNNRRIGNNLFKIIERFIYSRFDKIIAISPNVKQCLINWVVPSTNITMIHNGVALNKVRSAEKIDLQQILNLSDNHKNYYYLLMVARFEKQKDHETLIKAMDLLPDNFILLLAGEGSLKSNSELLAQKSSQKNRILFLGYRNDVYSLMKSVNLNILSTNYEGFSGVTLEMLGTGTPFIGSDVVGVNDIATDPEFLFSKGNHIELANKILKIYESKDLQNYLSELGIKIAEKFSINLMVSSYLNLYTDLFNKYNKLK